MQRTPDGLPSGIPGIGLDIEGAIQQAPQPKRHSIKGSMKKEIEMEEYLNTLHTLRTIKRITILHQLSLPS